jgi:hypothetical protein
MAASRPANPIIRGAAGLSEQEVQALTQAVRHGAAKAVLAGPVFDTIKLVADGFVEATLDRDRLGWPLAWAYHPGLEPPTDPPPPEWFEDAAVVAPSSFRASSEESPGAPSVPQEPS